MTSTTTRIVVTSRPLSDLALDPVNARVHSTENLDAIEASLKQFGQVEPLVVQRGSGKVIGGNGRLAVMRRLGWVSAEVVEVDADDLRAAALGIALNRTSETASWDQKALASLLSELEAAGALDGTGFDQEDIDVLLAELAPAGPVELSDPGEPPLPARATSRSGDLWLLGEHRLLVGDSTASASFKRLLQGEKAALLATDPPYCIDYTGAGRPGIDGADGGKDWSHVYREVDIPDLGAFLDQVFTACLPWVLDEAGVYIWHAHVKQPEIAAAFERHGLLLHQVLVWVKPTATFGHSYYRWKHEPCAFGWKRGHRPKEGMGQLETVWEADWDGKHRTTGFHPMSKPTRVFEIPIEQHTKPGDVVLEPFCGSGSQIIAAERLGRRCFAIEIQAAFVDGTILRWQEATGRKAVLEGTDQSFDDLVEERAKAS